MKFALLIGFLFLFTFCKSDLQNEKAAPLQQMQIFAVCDHCSCCLSASETSLVQDNDSTDQDLELLSPDDDGDDETGFQTCIATQHAFFQFTSSNLILSAFRLQSRFLEAITPPPPVCLLAA